MKTAQIQRPLRTVAACAALTALTAFTASGQTDPATATNKRHFIAVDDSTHSLVHVDQFHPEKNWTVSIDGYCMDLQKIAEDCVAVCADDGYSEFSLADGKCLKRVRGFGGKTHTIWRLPDGRTILGGIGIPNASPTGFIILDANDKLLSSVPLKSFQKIRHLRPASDTTLLAATVDKLVEVGLDGSVKWQMPLPGNLFKAEANIRNDGCILVSSGPGARTIHTVSAEHKVIATLNGDHLKEGSFTGFHQLPNGNLMVAVWLGHGTNHDGTVLVEYDPTGKPIWSFAQKSSTFVEVLNLNPIQ